MAETWQDIFLLWLLFFFLFSFKQSRTEAGKSTQRKKSLTKLQFIRASRKNNHKTRASGMETVLFIVSSFQPSLDLAANISKGSSACKHKIQGLDCCMEPSESSCLLPSFLSGAVKVLLHLQTNSMGSFPFLAWSRISYHQAFTSVRSKQGLNKIEISCSSSPTPRDFFFFPRDGEKQKGQLQNLGMPER